MSDPSTNTNTETRILYDSFEIKFNPNSEEYPWELWSDGTCQLSHSDPQELLEISASETDRMNQYTGSDGRPNHERHSGEYDHEEVLDTPAMELQQVPSIEVQAALWDVLEVNETVYLDEFCANSNVDITEARNAVKLFVGHGLVEWGLATNLPWLTTKGKEVDQPEWFEGESSQ